MNLGDRDPESFRGRQHASGSHAGEQAVLPRGINSRGRRAGSVPLIRRFLIGIQLEIDFYVVMIAAGEAGRRRVNFGHSFRNHRH